MFNQKSFLPVLIILVVSMISNSAWAHEVEYRYINVVEKSDLFQAPSATWIESDGSHHSLAEYKGKPIILHFWASCCPPCRREFGELDAWNNTHAKAQGITLLALSGDTRIGSAESFVREGGYKIPVRLTDDETQGQWMVRSIPTTYFIDAEGNVRGVVFGATDWSDPQMQAEVTSLLESSNENHTVHQTASFD